MIALRDLTPGQKRTLSRIGKKPARKLTPDLTRLVELELARQDGATLYHPTAEGRRLLMELHRIERMLYTVDSSGKKKRRGW